MRKYILMFAVFCALALGLIVACVPLPPPAESPASSATPSVTPSPAEHTVTVASWQASAISRMALADGNAYRIAEERYEVSVDSLMMPLMFGMSGVAGVPHLALARVVTGEVAAPAMDAAITWVLLASDPVTTTDVVWRETWAQSDVGGMLRVEAVEMLVAADSVVTFTAASDALTGFAALVQARDEYQARTGHSLWIDQVLVEEPGGDQGARWVSYVFNNDPGGGAGDEARRAYCCRLLRCGSVTDFWGKLLCRTRCGGVGC